VEIQNKNAYFFIAYLYGLKLEVPTITTSRINQAMFLLTATSFTPNQANTNYVTDDSLSVVAKAADGVIMEAKLRGAKTFTLNGTKLPPVKLYETLMLTPPTPFRDISIEALNGTRLVAEMTITLMDE
jgi:hypothetical protein